MKKVFIEKEIDYSDYVDYVNHHSSISEINCAETIMS